MNTIRGVNCEGLPSRRKRHARERLFSAAFHRTRIPFVLLVLVVPPRPANFPSIFVPSFDSNFDTPRHHLKSHRSSRKFRFSRTPFPLFPQRRHVHFQFIGTKRRYLSFIDPPRVRSFDSNPGISRYLGRRRVSRVSRPRKRSKLGNVSPGISGR